MNRCVHVRTQEQWDHVMSTLSKSYYNCFDSYPRICISFPDGCYCSYSYYESHGYEILSYEEYIKEKGLAPKKSNIHDVILINVPKI